MSRAPNNNHISQSNSHSNSHSHSRDVAILVAGSPNLELHLSSGGIENENTVEHQECPEKNAQELNSVSSLLMPKVDPDDDAHGTLHDDDDDDDDDDDCDCDGETNTDETPLRAVQDKNTEHETEGEEKQLSTRANQSISINDNESNHNDLSEQEHMTMNMDAIAIHNGEIDIDVDVGDVSGVNTSFASDFSCEMERMTLMQNNSSPNENSVPNSHLLIHEQASSFEESDGDGDGDGISEWSNSQSHGDGDGSSESRADRIENENGLESSQVNDIDNSCHSHVDEDNIHTSTSGVMQSPRSPWGKNTTHAINACGIGIGRSASDSTATSIEVGDGDANALGAMRSPWGNNDNSVGSSTVTSINDDRIRGLGAIRSLPSDLPTLQKDLFTSTGTGTGTGSEDGLGTLPSPWNKYLKEEERSIQPTSIDSLLTNPDISSDVSSISNQSSVTHSSVSTCLSNQSPSLQHLEYLAKNSTAAYVMKFTPEDKQRRRCTTSTRTRTRNPLKNTADRLSVEELRQIYGCKSRREAMKLSIDQSNCLSAASNVLVDLLFQYLREHCGVRTQQLFDGTNNNGERKMGSRSKEAQRGLSLPAAAIGWLSSHIYPDESDQQYHQQWQDKEENCLPNASPAPQVQNKLSLLKVLLAKHVTHLRVTGAPWPGPMKKYRKKKVNAGQSFETPRRRGRMLLNVDAQSASSFLCYFRNLQNNPRVDMKLFPNVEYLQIDGIAPEWIQNLRATNDTLVKMTMQRGCLHNFSRLIGVDIGKGQVTEKARNKSHEAIFENGAYDDILGVATKQTSPLVKMPLPSEEGDDADSVGEQGNKAYGNLAIYPLLNHLTLSRCGIGELSSFTESGNTTSNVACHGVSSEGQRDGSKRTTISFLEGLITLDLSHNEFICAKSALSGLDRALGLSAINLSDNKLLRCVITLNYL